MMAGVNPKLLHVPKHQLDRMISAPLADNLREAYKIRSLRVVKGDSIKVMRGEYKGVEGKVENVDVEHGTLNIEGVQREKIRGGQVKVPIHASKVMIVNLNLTDKLRSNKVQGDKPKVEPKAESEDKPETKLAKEESK
ncbi:MAG TPA: 50S ribosomal protein L24 [Nitrososphaera sp.]|nr:50S ribosomal protein L24 [Nitrososphaera sp.]